MMRIAVRAFFVFLSGVPLCLAATSPCSDQDRKEHRSLCRLLDRMASDKDQLSKEIREWSRSRGLLVDMPPLSNPTEASEVARRLSSSSAQQAKFPVVAAHGMGDSCFNSGMKNIVKHASSLLGGVYGVCIPLGDNLASDTSNGYFLNMDASVDMFAAKVRADPNLQNGFNAFGFSQGNNVIRGYIARYNEPPVNAFISVHGVNAGEGALPNCFPSDSDEGGLSSDVGGFMCNMMMDMSSREAYTTFSQQHSFQANYWRDPRASQYEEYRKYSQLAQWNGEGYSFNETFKANWAKTSKYVWIMAEQDQMVWPHQGEHWGAPDPSNPFEIILPMNETEWYLNDWFGLRTAQEAGKNVFLTTPGGHLQFSTAEFDSWITAYFS